MRSIASSSGKSTTGRSNYVPTTARAAMRGLSRLAPDTAASLAESVFLKPLRLPSPRREEWWATDAEAVTLPRSNGGTLAGWIWGWSGPTVLLVHGWGGRGLQMGAFAAPLVEAGFRVVAFDGPGHGRSPGRRSSLPEFVGAVRDVIDHLGGVHGVVAHSFGAASTTVALGDAFGPPPALLPERLVYVAPAADFESVAARFTDLTGFSPAVVGRMRRNLERRFDMDWRQVQPYRLAPTLEQRLLILHDENDDEVSWLDSRRLAQAWPGARLELTRGFGHHRILRQVSTVAKAVDFLSD